MPSIYFWFDLEPKGVSLFWSFDLGLISSGCFLLSEKACNFDVVWELLDEVLARVPLCSLVDLQDVIGVEIEVGLFDSV